MTERWPFTTAYIAVMVTLLFLMRIAEWWVS